MRSLAWLVVFVLAGCGGSARYVVRDDEGGLLALEGDEGTARGEARRLMREHCGTREARVTADGEYTVAMREEGEVTQDEVGRRIADDQTSTTAAMIGDSRTTVPASRSATTLRTDGEPELYDSSRNGAPPRIPHPVREHRIEYECEGDDE